MPSSAVGSGIYDDSDPAWTYTGTWQVYNGSGPYDNTLHETITTGNYAEVTFNGVQVKLTYLKASGRGSIDVYIDNIKVTTLNANSASVVWQATWTSSALISGVHTIRFQNAGGGWIDLDALQVYDVIPPVGAGIYDDTNSAWSYTGTWQVFNGSGPYANTLHQNNTTGNYASVTFSGVQVKLTYLKAPGRGSIDVYIDNINVTTISANSPSVVWQATWTSQLLTAGTHTIRFQNAGGGWIDLDALQVFAPVPPAIYDDNNSAWTYSGTWQVYNGSGPYANTLHQSSTTGNYAEVMFNGGQVKLTYLKAPGRGSIDVYIDNSKVTTLNANSASVVWQVTWTSQTLPDGIHTIRFQNAGGGWIDLDAIQVFAPDIRADLIIQSITVTPVNPAINQAVSFSVVIKNQGLSDASNFFVDLFIDAPLPSDCNSAGVVFQSNINLAAGASQTLTINYSGFTTGGPHSVNGTVDINCRINEGDESNNTKLINVDVAVEGGIYDDAHSAWRYTGTWQVYNGSGPSANTLHQSNTTGSYADVIFKGTQVKLTYLQAPGRGLIDVYIDGGKVTTLNANSASIVWQAIWTSAVLSSTVHTVRFQNAGGGWIDLDAIQVFAPDTIAPADITTLAASTGTGNGVINLNWTAVGDDNNTGTATTYLVRYSSGPISTNTDWNNATVVTSGIPTPKAAGQAETMTVFGLTGGQVYYFAVRAQDDQANLGALSNSPSATASTSTTVSVGIYDDADPAWSYSGTWQVYNGSGPYANTLHESNITGNYAEVTFDAAQVKLTYLKAPNRGSIDIYMDNIKVTTLNANSASLVWQATWTSPALPAGVHTIRFQNAGGGWNDLDALQVLPPVTAGTYDDSNNVWSYSGTWQVYNGSGPYANTLHESNITGNSAEVYFNGSQVVLTYLQAPGRGSIDVYIDNALVTTLNANNASIVWQVTWTSASLTPGVHTVRFQNAGGGWIDLDAVTVLQ